MQKQTGNQKIIAEGKNVENGFWILTLHLICHQTWILLLSLHVSSTGRNYNTTYPVSEHVQKNACDYCKLLPILESTARCP